MDNKDSASSEEQGFSVSDHPDTFTAGEAMLARAKSISQRIADRVRKLTQETETGAPDQATDEQRSSD